MMVNFDTVFSQWASNCKVSYLKEICFYILKSIWKQSYAILGIFKAGERKNICISNKFTVFELKCFH